MKSKTKSLVFSLILIFSLFFIHCDKEEYRCPAGSPNIVGAMCKDGTRSSATGQGACSHHGGVDYWICKDD